VASSLTEVARLVAVDDTPLKRRVPFFIACGILVLLIVIAGVFLYQSQEQQARVTATEQLRSISSLKADEIARWRSDRIYDARTISASGFFIEGVSEYLSSPSESKERVILTRFREVNQSVHYHNVILVDQNATVILSLDPGVGSISPMTALSVTESLQNGTAVMTDFHLMPGTDHPHLDVVAPLISSSNGSDESVGAVILSIDPDAYLYPFIESWPVPTRSAETLLVERQGDHVLFLNDLKHMEHTALNLTIPLTETDVPAVMAVLGKIGDFEGRDYRGVRVISDIRPVPGSPWFMVAKVDTEEAFASWAAQSILIIIIGAGLLGGILIATAWIWQRGQKLHYQSLYALEEEKKRAEQISRERAEALLHLAGMETATGQELAEYVMDAACRLTGSTLAFVGTMSPDESVFDLTAWSRSAMDECEVSQAPLHFPVAWAGIWADAVRRREPVVVNDYAAPLSGKKGLPAGHVPIQPVRVRANFEGHRVVMICAVANKATEYLSEDVDQLVLLMQGVWGHFQKRAVTDALQKKHADLEAAYEEITATQEELQANYEELAKSQQALHESERKYRNLYQFAQVGLFETSLKDALVVACNQRYCDLFGFPDISAAIGKDVLGLYVNPSEREEVSRILHEQGYIDNHVVRFRNRATGRPFWGQFSARLNRENDVAEGSIIDITAQKEAEAKLQETNAYLSNLFDYANAPIIVWDPEFRITRFNHAFERLTGWKSDAVIGKEVSILFPERTRERSMAFLHHAMGGERWETVEIPILRKDGSERIVLWNSATLYAEDGKTVIAAIAQGQDITERKAAEEALRESEERYREFFVTSRDSVFITTPDGRWVDFNDASLEIFGFPSREDLYALPLPQLYEHPEERDAFLALIKQEGFVKEHPVCLRKKDGTVIDTLITAAPIRNSDGSIRSFIGSIRDVTDKKKAEEALRESEERFRETIRLLDEGYYRCTLNGTLIAHNLAFNRILGFDPGRDLKGTILPDFWQDRCDRDAYLEELMKSGVIHNFSIHAKRVDGSPIIVLASAHLVTDTMGRFVEIEGTFTDITKLKRAEEELIESERKYRTLFEHMNAGFVLFEVVADENGVPVDLLILAANEGFATTTGTKLPDVIGKRLTHVLPGIEHDAADWIGTYGQVALTGTSRQFEQGSDLLGVYYAVSAFQPVPRQCAVTFVDITGRKKMEMQREQLIQELEQKNAELERFTYTVSHDLKSPLITIRGFAGLLEEDALKGDITRTRQDISRIIAAADKMQHLLTDLLNLSRIGRLINPPEDVPLGMIIQEAVDLLAGSIKEHGICVEVAPNLPTVHVDHTRIREVYINLIENAIKFTKRVDHPTIEAGMRKEKGETVFFVRDNGIGIEPRYLSKIFGLFEKLDGRSEGTGIGLAIVKRIIEVHGGRIWAESEGPGKGTTICFTLPLNSEQSQ